MKKVLIPILTLLLLFSSCAFPGTVQKPGSALLESETASSQTTGADPVTTIPDYESFDLNEGFDERGYRKNIRALDYVTLGDYRSLDLPADVIFVGEEDLKEAIDDFMSSYGTNRQLTDKVIENGDSVNIDYVGTIDGVAFAGGSTQGIGTTVTIGVTSYIDNFLDQLIGHKPGDSFDIFVTFPENYGVEELNGKAAVFATTVNYVVGEFSVPELSEAFVKESLSDTSWKTVQDVKDALTDRLLQSQLAEYLDPLLEEICAVPEIPKSLMDFEESYMLSYFADYSSQMGMTLEDFLNTYNSGTTLEELLEQYRETNEHYVRMGLIYQAIAETEGIEGSEESVLAYLKSMGSSDLKSFEEAYGANYLRMLALTHDVYARIRSYSAGK